MSAWFNTRTAISQAIAAAAAFPPEKVLWKAINVDDPPFDFISIDVSSSESPAVDGISETYDGTRPAGEEIKRQVFGYREITLDIEIFTNATVTTVDKSDALAVAERIRSALRFEGIRAQAAKAGVVFLDIEGPISYVPEVINTKFRGRAFYTIRCNVTAEALVEYIGYINSAGGVATIGGGTPDPEDVDFLGSGS